MASATKVGLGFGQLGNSVGEEAAEELVRLAFDVGIHRFDTAPFYGCGESEERLGRILLGYDRAAYQLSTKVGRYRPDTVEDHWDYSRDTTLRSIERSLNRLRTDRLDIVFLHDCENRVEEASGEAYRALRELKAQGVVGAIGSGSVDAAAHAALLGRVDLDILMVAGRYTLLDQTASDELFPMCLERGIDVELAGPFNSGILATGPDFAAARFDYRQADDAIRNRVRAIEAICSQFDVPLKRAALAYAGSHPAVNRLVLGLATPPQLMSNLRDLTLPVPDALWMALAGLGIALPEPVRRCD